MAGLLGTDGNIDINRLEKDLRKALDFDIKYKQTDNMKKRACKVATDYDEFKNMVACAHLKTLSRKEINDLSTNKKGWQKSSANKGSSSGALILSDEMGSGGDGTISTTFKLPAGNTAAKKPKSPMELDRDLRKCNKTHEKISYLASVGIKRVCKLLEVDANADLFESLLVVLLAHVDTSSSANSVRADQEIDTKPGTEDSESVVPTEESIDVYHWFQSFTTLGRFDFMIRFLSKELMTTISRWIEKCEKEGCVDTATKYTIKS